MEVNNFKAEGIKRCLVTESFDNFSIIGFDKELIVAEQEKAIIREQFQQHDGKLNLPDVEKNGGCYEDFAPCTGY